MTVAASFMELHMCSQELDEFIETAANLLRGDAHVETCQLTDGEHLMVMSC